MIEKTKEKPVRKNTVVKKPVKKTAIKEVKKSPVKKPSKKQPSKPAIKKTTKKSKKAASKDNLPSDGGIVIVEDDVVFDRTQDNEMRRAYLEEHRSQEATD